jgi:hypothetical protein
MLIGAAIGGLLIGLLAGCLISQRKGSWCPVCGVTLTCPDRHCSLHVERELLP